jgi:hypothetical protein
MIVHGKPRSVRWHEAHEEGPGRTDLVIRGPSGDSIGDDDADVMPTGNHEEHDGTKRTKKTDRSILVGCGSGGDSCPDDDVKR